MWHEFLSEIRIGWRVFAFGPEFWIAFPVLLALVLMLHVGGRDK